MDLLDCVEGVNLRQLPPLTTLLVRTWNSLYRVVVMDGSSVYVQGGAFFREPTLAQLDGASWDGCSLVVGWIGVGLVMELRDGARRVMTSPVLTITTERHGSLVVH